MHRRIAVRPRTLLAAATATAFALALPLLAAPTAPAAASAAAPLAAGVADLPDSHTVASPDGSLTASIGLDDSRLRYDVMRDGTEVVASSALGFVLRQPDIDLTEGFEITSVDTAEVDEEWTPAWGTEARIRNRANELTVHAREIESGVELDVIVRMLDDGVGFRYHFPEQEALDGEVIIAAETTEFALPADMTAYSIRAGTDQAADERHYTTRPLPEVETAQTPITLVRESDSLFVSIHEAALIDYPSMTLKRDSDRPGALDSELIALPGGDKAVLDIGSGGFDTPWRTLTIGHDAGDLGESHLIENLNDPCAICDVDSDGDDVADTTDWINPGTYVGVWWELQRRHTTWDAGPRHGATTERIKEYIDLAAKVGAKSVLAEGWNTNAGGSWTNQDFLTPQPDVDIDEVLAYAESNDVGFIAHNETRGYVDYYDAHLEEIFSQYQAWGIHEIKTGYATRFELGGVNRSHYDQEAVRHYQRVIELAAKYDIAVNAHESIKPTGLSRTYPNMMTGEGVAGMEQQNYKGANGNPPEQATILPFTRWMGGPADYTPGVVNVTWDPANLGTRVQSTTAHQLALYSVFSSPLQMLADTPENYELFPDAVDYLTDMPASWDDSVVVDARMGDYTVTARRSDDTWYLGAITDENRRSVPVNLDFLEPGVTYAADILTDGADASWHGKPMSLSRTRVLVNSEDTLNASMVDAGGYAVRLRPATDAELGGLPDYTAPAFTIVDEPVSSYDPKTNAVTLTATVRNDGQLGGDALELSADGTELATLPFRLKSGQTSDFSVTVPATDLAYAEQNVVSVSLADAEPEDFSLTLLPYPGDQLRAALDRPADELAPAVGALLTDRVDQLHTAADKGDFSHVRQLVQAVRYIVLGTDQDDLADAAAEEIETITAEYLGGTTGLMRIMERLRDITDPLEADSAAELRDLGATATADAILGNEEGAGAALEALEENLAAVDEEGADELLQTVRVQNSDPVILEAEDADLSGGASINAQHPGYSGSGFVRDLSTVGAAATFTPDVTEETMYDASFRYANGMTGAPLDRQLSLTAADDEAQRVDFPNLGQDPDRWRRWDYSPAAQVTLAPENNALELGFAVGDTGHINLDHLRLTPVSGVLADAELDGAPAVVLSAPPADSGDWHTDEVTVDVAVADDVPGALDVETSTDSPAADAPETAAAATAVREGTVVLSGDGTRRVTATARDAAGNVSPEAGLEVRLDTTAPVITATSDADARVASVTAEDATSGVAEIQYRVNGGDWEPYDEPVQIGPEAVEFEARAVDVAGNLSDGASASFASAGDGGDGNDGGSAGEEGAVPGGDGVLPGTGGAMDWWLLGTAVLLLLLGGAALAVKRITGSRR